jgi:hypothetical protein
MADANLARVLPILTGRETGPVVALPLVRIGSGPVA